MSTSPERNCKRVSFDVPDHLFDAFMETANDFFSQAHEGTTLAQRAAEVRAQDRDAGLDALASLLDVAQGDAGQAGVIARFLAGLYNGQDYPFDLTELRGLDEDLFERCLAVLRLDNRPAVEVHDYFPAGAARWQEMIKCWGIASRPVSRGLDFAQVSQQTYEADYVGIADAPGYRDVTLFVTVRTECEPAKAIGIHLSTLACGHLTSDLLALHRRAWEGEHGRPIDVLDGEVRPHWVEATPTDR
jgi:hypothetical protein